MAQGPLPKFSTKQSPPGQITAINQPLNRTKRFCKKKEGLKSRAKSGSLYLRTTSKKLFSTCLCSFVFATHASSMCITFHFRRPLISTGLCLTLLLTAFSGLILFWISSKAIGTQRLTRISPIWNKSQRITHSKGGLSLTSFQPFHFLCFWTQVK